MTFGYLTIFGVLLAVNLAGGILVARASRKEYTDEPSQGSVSISGT